MAQDLSAFNPHIAALAMPQSGVLSETGRALMGMSAFLRDERMSKAQEKALEQNTKLAEQQYNFNTAFNPQKLKGIELQNAHSAFALERSKADEEHRQALRPFEVRRAHLQNEGIKASNNYTNAQTSEIWSNTNIEARLGEMSFSQEPKLWSEELIKRIQDDKELTPSQKHYRTKIINRARARYAAGRAGKSGSGGVDEASVEELFNIAKEDARIAGILNALNEDGTVNQDALYKRIQGSVDVDRKRLAKVIFDARTKHENLDKNISSAASSTTTMLNSLEQIMGKDGNGRMGDFTGLGDVIYDSVRSGLNYESALPIYENLVTRLKQERVRLLMNSKSNVEREELNKYADFNPTPTAMTGYAKGQFCALVREITDLRIATYQNALSGEPRIEKRKELERMIKEAQEFRRKGLIFGEDPSLDTKPVWQDLPVQNQTPQNPAGENQIPQNPSPQNPAPMQNLYQGTRSGGASLSEEKTKQLDGFWN